jgi:hypothetical protein
MFGIITFALSILGVLLAVSIVIFVGFRLPAYLEQERTYHPPLGSFAPVHVASTVHVNLEQRPLSRIDGNELEPGSRVLLKDQNDTRENGIWIVPTGMEAPWTRAMDLISSSQLVDGAHVLVLHGNENRDRSFVLRVLTQRDSFHNAVSISRLFERYAPGTVEMVFVPMLTHLLGDDASSKCGQIMQVDESGMPYWVSPSTLRSEIEELKRERGSYVRDIGSIIPEKIHFIHGLWDTEMSETHKSNVELWKERNVGFQVKIWDRPLCEQLIRSEFPQYWNLYKNNRSIVQNDVLKWLILYNQGGYIIDIDTKPLTDSPNIRNIYREHNHPQILFLTENMVSQHEVESLKQFAICKDHHIRPGPRIATHFFGVRPRHPLVHFMMQHISQHVPQMGTDHYDVVFASGTDALTYVYSLYGEDFNDKVLLSLQDSQRLLHHARSNSWQKV